VHPREAKSDGADRKCACVKATAYAFALLSAWCPRAQKTVLLEDSLNV